MQLFTKYFYDMNATDTMPSFIRQVQQQFAAKLMQVKRQHNAAPHKDDNDYIGSCQHI